MDVYSFFGDYQKIIVTVISVVFSCPGTKKQNSAIR